MIVNLVVIVSSAFRFLSTIGILVVDDEEEVRTEAIDLHYPCVSSYYDRCRSYGRYIADCPRRLQSMPMVKFKLETIGLMETRVHRHNQMKVMKSFINSLADVSNLEALEERHK